MTMTTYMITGAAGFIANKICEMLIENGDSVVGIDNMNDAYDVRIKQWRLERLKKLKGFTFYHEDIGDLDTLTKISKKHSPITAIINLAARAGVRFSVENPWEFYRTNLTGTLNLLEICRKQGIHKFVLASTSSAYGENPPLPTPETADTNQPLQPYAASKKAAEVLSYTYHYLYNIDVTVFRYFTVYGPAGRPDLAMFRFAQWISENRPVLINGDGSQSRGFTYLDDIARGTILGLKPVGYEIINLGGHETISVNDLISILEAKIGKKAMKQHLPRHPADVTTSWADVSKAKKLLQWTPIISLDEGISNLVAWYQAERNWAKDILTQ